MVQSLEVTNRFDVDDWPPGADLIPKERYISREFAELEADRLWPRVWQVACREEEIPNVGDYVEYAIADQSIIVVRDQPDRLRAYFNACRHRGNMLKQGCGNAKEIRCRYHGWRWHLDGTIKEVVDAYDFNPESVSADKLCLPECLVDTWGGFVFINMDPEAESLQSFLGPAVLDRLGRYGWEDMRFTRYRTTVVRANWKTALDAFMLAAPGRSIVKNESADSPTIAAGAPTRLSGIRPTPLMRHPLLDAEDRARHPRQAREPQSDRRVQGARRPEPRRAA